MPHVQNALEGWIDPRVAGTACCLCGKKVVADRTRCWIESPKQPGVEVQLSAGIAVAAHSYCITDLISRRGEQGAVDELCRIHQQACYAVITGRHMGVL